MISFPQQDIIPSSSGSLQCVPQATPSVKPKKKHKKKVTPIAVIQPTQSAPEVAPSPVAAPFAPVIPPVADTPAVTSPSVSTADSDTGTSDKFLSKIITDQQQALDTYGSLTVNTIPQWKYDIMNSEGLSDQDKLLYIVVNNIECGREDGFCLSSKRGNV